MAFVAADQTNEVAIPVQHCPDASDFGERTFAGTTSHGEREETSTDDRFFDLVDHFQVVRRPFKVKRQPEVSFAESAE
ncbi:MAG: hypothetical protein KDA71_20810 [Planctomycetales bacterium]|nr:hypothetical protein [Planctomycetales bacterium]